MRAVKGAVQSARLGMAPSLLSNALVVWGGMASAFPTAAGWLQIAKAVAVGVCFFLYGMWENDRVDARWDARHRPDKPVPKGLITVWQLRVLSLVAGMLGLILANIFTGNPLPGVILLIVITLYNWLHKRHVFSVVLMGMCRSIWVMLAILVFASDFSGGIESLTGMIDGAPLYYAYSLGLYTIVASLIARGEAGSPARKKLAIMLLSGMCLHDAVWLMCLGQYSLALVAAACYGVSLLLRKMKQKTT